MLFEIPLKSLRIKAFLKRLFLFPYYSYKSYLHRYILQDILNNTELISDLLELTQTKMSMLNLQNLALTSQSMGISGKIDEKENIIISLTSFGLRVNDVYLTLESVFQQSVKADRIILWLSETEFSRENLPEMLLKAESRGLQIDFCKDMKSYNKLIPTLRKYPQDLVITIDDDILYPVNFIERLVREYRKSPNIIHCYRGRRIVFNEDNQLASYNQWKICTDDFSPSLKLLPTGVGGVLYFPGCFHEDMLRDDIFLSLAPDADDLWFRAMSLLKRVPCQVIEQYQDVCGKLTMIPSSQEKSLWAENSNEASGNNRQIFNLINYYPEILSVLLENEE